MKVKHLHIQRIFKKRERERSSSGRKEDYFMKLKDLELGTWIESHLKIKGQKGAFECFSVLSCITISL